MSIASHLRRWLQSLLGECQEPGRGRKSASVSRRARLGVECLEDRSVPSILFGNPSALSATDGGGPVLTNAHVELIFWGSAFAGSAAGQAASIQSGVDTILGSHYLDALSQYRSDIGPATRVGTVYVTDSSPGTNFTDQDVDTMLQAQIAKGNLPAPISDPQLFYFVVTQPGSNNSGEWGAHWFDTATPPGAPAPQVFHYGWTINDGTVDTVTDTFSHELVEAITDPEGTSILTSNGGELCDGNAQHFDYRLNGTLVQSYFSQQDHAFIVPTGQAQDFWVSRNRVLTINGGQLANVNDSLTIDTDGNGGVLVTLNGESAQFDPFSGNIATWDTGLISAITVNTGDGNETIDVERTLAGVPVTINEGAGNDTVNISPLLQNLGNIQGNVTVNGGSGTDRLNIDDQSSYLSSSYTLTNASVSRGSAVINYNWIDHVTLNGSSGNDTFNVTSTESFFTTNINTGSGVDTVNVMSTGASGTLNIQGQGQPFAPDDTVNLGNAGSVQGIQGTVNITNPPWYNKIVVDDHLDTVARTAVLSSFTPAGGFTWGRITAIAPGTINYRFADTDSVTIKTGKSGSDVVNVLATGVTTDLIGNGDDTVNVGNNGSVQGIQGTLNVEDPGHRSVIDINDSADAAARSAVLNSFLPSWDDDSRWGSLTGLAPAAIDYEYADTSALCISINRQSTVNVLDTGGVPTTVLGGRRLG